MATQKKIPIQGKIAEELGVVISFLDPKLKARTEQEADPSARWPLRRTIAFVLACSLIGWGAFFAAIYFLFRLF
jgi:uncharacterized membrane protein YbhN (UPF0104 family)